MKETTLVALALVFSFALNVGLGFLVWWITRTFATEARRAREGMLAKSMQDLAEPVEDKPDWEPVVVPDPLRGVPLDVRADMMGG